MLKCVQINDDDNYVLDIIVLKKPLDINDGQINIFAYHRAKNV